MRFHLITIFPQFFDVLQLSLLGKAAEQGILSWRVTDLRDFTQDRHHRVDDTPYGGGAGMVMRADVWGKAIDAAIDEFSVGVNVPDLRGVGSFDGEDTGGGSDESGSLCRKTVLAIPTPSGQPLTQAKIRELSGCENLIVACGRYEGIDSRVARYYRQSGEVEVFEYSLGDYVLNGGEVAALALVEGVGRLLDGTVGNPDSLVEESHEGSGLLEYPMFTRPLSWRGLDVPEVLRGGNHRDIAFWRDAQSLDLTARLRPDKLSRLRPDKLSGRQREQLAGLGWLYLSGASGCEDGCDGGAPTADSQLATSGFTAVEVAIRRPDRGEVSALVELGSRTFPLACPDFITSEQISCFIAEEFDAGKVAARLDDSEHHRYLVAEVAGKLVGYTHIILGLGGSQAAAAGITAGDIYVSKCYTLASMHGTGLAGALLEAAISDARRVLGESGSFAAGMGGAVSLGTSTHNKRAQRFYRKHGFRRVGSRIFVVGGVKNRDVVMRREFS